MYGAYRARTYDPLLVRQMLSQLSLRPHISESQDVSLATAPIVYRVFPDMSSIIFISLNFSVYTMARYSLFQVSTSSRAAFSPSSAPSPNQVSTCFTRSDCAAFSRAAESCASQASCSSCVIAVMEALSQRYAAVELFNPVKASQAVLAATRL